MYKGQIEAWIATLLIEGVIAAVLARPFGIVWWRAAMAAMAGSLVSHPIVWWLHIEHLRPAVGYWWSFAVVELFAWLSEVPFYRLAGATWWRALWMSLAVNAVSATYGLAKHYVPLWLGWLG